jgi:hypothetical protein
MSTAARADAHRPIGVVALLAALLAAALAGCSTVPTTGPIEQGPVVDSAESTQFIRVIAAPPSQGAEPAEIVRGFLEANASLEQDHAIARRYLTDAGSAQWDPQAGTTVFSATSLRVSPSNGTVRVDVSVLGRLLPVGTLEVVEPAEPTTLTFTLEKVPEGGGADATEWRIVDPPPGIFISATDLRRAYRLYETYFPSARSTVLVPDGRLIPVVGASLPTTLAELVLAGPSEWLSPGVRTGVPAGTTLALGAVPVRDGVADVELSDQALSATQEQRRDLAAQLTWTLTQLPDVTTVRLSSAGEPFEVPGSALDMTRETWRAMAPDALSVGTSGVQSPPSYVLDGTTVVRTTPQARTQVTLPAEVEEPLAGLAVSLDQRRAAAGVAGGAGLWLLPLDRTSTARRLDTGRIGDISFDVDGRPWVLDDGRVQRVGIGGRAEPVEVSGQDLGRITALRLARDGARVALVAGGTVNVGVISDDEDGPAIVSVHRVDTTVAGATALAWHDASSLDVLGKQAGGSRQVLRLTLGNGQVLPLGAPALPLDLAAAPAALTLVATRAGSVFGNVGLQWRDQGTGTSVAYPG